MWLEITDKCVRKYERLVDLLHIKNSKANGVYNIHRKLGYIKKNEIL